MSVVSSATGLQALLHHHSCRTDILVISTYLPVVEPAECEAPAAGRHQHGAEDGAGGGQEDAERAGLDMVQLLPGAGLK